MADPWAGYDAWLERPYQEHYARQEAHEVFVEWCEARDFDPESEEGRAAYEDALEDAAERRAEQLADWERG